MNESENRKRDYICCISIIDITYCCASVGLIVRMGTRVIKQASRQVRLPLGAKEQSQQNVRVAGNTASSPLVRATGLSEYRQRARSRKLATVLVTCSKEPQHDY